MKPSLLTLTLLSISPVYGAEVDNFSTRNVPLENMAEVVNAKANDFLNLGLWITNEQGSCDNSEQSEVRLYTNLKTYFANHRKGEFLKFLLHDESVHREETPLLESIYQDWSAADGFVLAKASPLLSPVIRIGDVGIGSDKFEHMFGMGFIYFNGHYLRNKALNEVLKQGALRERYLLGGLSLETGVFSYGDLAANFNGMRFWNHMLQKRDDVLGTKYNIGPYVECRDNLWVQVKQIDFRSYVDPSMDEAINCSKFASSSGLLKFQQRMKELNKDYRCPLDVRMNQQLKVKYKEFSDWIVNPDSNDVL